MNILLKRISISLLLIASVTGARADPRDERDGRDRARAERQQPGGADRNEDQQRGGYQGQPAPDQSRRQGRMSPEERQALRRQINEAGQDIYIKPR
ncbi:MAG: hypothetical protein JWQ23_2639 [Herminiimonas sp.]|jgi:hypothetical protein|nr:hypothetical protein [Herminiimonas sp.]